MRRAIRLWPARQVRYGDYRWSRSLSPEAKRNRIDGGTSVSAAGGPSAPCLSTRSGPSRCQSRTPPASLGPSAVRRARRTVRPRTSCGACSEAGRSGWSPRHRWQMARDGETPEILSPCSVRAFRQKRTVHHRGSTLPALPPPGCAATWRAMSPVRAAGQSSPFSCAADARAASSMLCRRSPRDLPWARCVGGDPAPAGTSREWRPRP